MATYVVFHRYPVLAGGIGEGILPLSLGYSAITGMGSEQLVAQLIPATIIGNFFAIMYRIALSLGRKTTRSFWGWTIGQNEK